MKCKPFVGKNTNLLAKEFNEWITDKIKVVHVITQESRGLINWGVFYEEVSALEQLARDNQKSGIELIQTVTGQKRKRGRPRKVAKPEGAENA